MLRRNVLVSTQLMWEPEEPRRVDVSWQLKLMVLLPVARWGGGKKNKNNILTNVIIDIPLLTYTSSIAWYRLSLREVKGLIWRRTYELHTRPSQQKPLTQFCGCVGQPEGRLREPRWDNFNLSRKTKAGQKKFFVSGSILKITFGTLVKLHTRVTY